MAKTAADLTHDEWRAYRPSGTQDVDQALQRWERAWQVARQAGGILRERFGAMRVVAFGSLAHRPSFTAWSDIDLAAWGIADDEFFRAVGVVTGLSAEFAIDLVDMATCRGGLREQIEREGVEV